MSWLSALSDTYDNFYGSGVADKNDPIVPVGFVEKSITFSVYLDENGNFVRADKGEKKLLIPSSPSAAGRTGPPIPYPLYDEIRYVAGDTTEVLPESLNADFTAYFDAYITQLREWSEADGSPHVLSVLLGYLERKTLFRDLCEAGCINTEKDFASTSAFSKGIKSMVAFCIYIPSKNEYVDIASMPEIASSWCDHLLSTISSTGICYAEGNMTALASKHQKLYGNAKLISSENSFNKFQYEGRFTSADEACTVGYATSEKAHNTLRWLISRQGFQKFSLKFVTWSKKCYDVIQPSEDPEDLLGDEEEIRIDTAEDYAKRINMMLSGYKAKIPDEKNDSIVMIGLEAATPGRFSINYYQELDSDDYLERLGKWYKGCCWRLNYFGKDRTLHTGIMTPSIGSMGNAVFGKRSMNDARSDLKAEKSGTKQVKSFYLDMFSCIAEGRRAPTGYTMAAYHRVLKPQSFTDRNGSYDQYEWLNCMAVTLAMLKSTDMKGVYNVALNEHETDRSYLYGRLLAIADVMEENVLRTQSDNRQTNAVRLFTAMQQHPAATWSNLEQKILPYEAKLSAGLRTWYNRQIDEIYHIGVDMGSNAPLSPRFIEGYHNQRYELKNRKKEEN